MLDTLLSRTSQFASKIRHDSKVSYIILPILLLLTSLYAFSNIFLYGICCDDILAAFNSKAYGASPSMIFSPYGGQVLGIKIMYELFGLESKNYFLTLYILRLLSTFSVYQLGYTLSRNKLVGFFTAALYLLGYAGVGTAEYAHLANIFISASILNFGVVMLINFYRGRSKKYDLKSMIYFSIICFILSISIIIATVRVNGIIILFLISEMAMLLFKTSTFKAAIWRILIFYLFIYLLRLLGSFGGNSPYHLSMISHGVSITFGSFQSTIKSIYYFVSIYFDILSPPLLDQIILNMLTKIHFIESINNNLIFLVFFVSLVIFAVFLFKKTKKYLFFFFTTIWFFYLLGFKYLFGDIYAKSPELSSFIATTHYPFHAVNALFGGLFIFLAAMHSILLLITKRRGIASKMQFALAWTFCFMISTFFFSPRTFAFETFLYYPIQFQESYVHYYFIPSVGVYLYLVFFLVQVFPSFSIIKNLARKILFFEMLPLQYIITVLLITANLIGVKTFIDGRLYFRSAKVLEATSNTINAEIRYHYSILKRPIVFVTVNDQDDNIYPYIVTEWGFSQFRYPLLNSKYVLVPYFAGNSFEDLKKIIGDDKFANDHGLKKPVTIDDIYGFKIEGLKIYSETNHLRALLKSQGFR